MNVSCIKNTTLVKRNREVDVSPNDQLGPSCSWSYSCWICSYLCNQVSSYPAHGEVYSIQYYVIKVPVTCGRSVVFSGFLHQLNCPPRYAEKLLKVSSNNITPTGQQLGKSSHWRYTNIQYFRPYKLSPFYQIHSPVGPSECQSLPTRLTYINTIYVLMCLSCNCKMIKIVSKVMLVHTWYRGLGSGSGQTKDYTICICCFFTKHTALGRKIQDWMARNKDIVGEVSIRGMLFLWASTIQIQISALV